MNKTISISCILTAVVITALSCNSNGQSKNIKDAKETQAAIKKMSPGGVATTAGGYTMTAKINGKDWAASSIIPPDIAGVIVGDNDGEMISLPYYNKKSFLGLKKRKLGKGHDGVDMRLNDEVKFWGATTGEMEITKVDADWAEGTFSFTASGLQSDKTITVTNGFFRIALAKDK